MLVDEVRALVKKKTENVDVSLQMDYIKENALKGSVIFYPMSDYGLRMTELRQHASSEQLAYLRHEGFKVESHYVQRKPGYLNEEGRPQYIGEKVSW